jgi:hypothetical protein
MNRFVNNNGGVLEMKYPVAEFFIIGESFVVMITEQLKLNFNKSSRIPTLLPSTVDV